MVRTIPPSFVEIRPKLRVVALLTWEWPKTAKNRGESQKMTPSSETEIFLGWFQWESCSPGYSGNLLHWHTHLMYHKYIHAQMIFTSWLYGQGHSLRWMNTTTMTYLLSIFKWPPDLHGHEWVVHWAWSWLRSDTPCKNWKRMAGQVGTFLGLILTAYYSLHF